MFFLDNFKSDCLLRTMFLSKSDAVKSVWKAFENYVTVYIICLCLSALLANKRVHMHGPHLRALEMQHYKVPS